MNTKHTPGPWIVETMPDNTPYIESNAGSICSMGPCDDDREGWVAANQDVANSRLIAAAPELLEALQDCERLLCLIGQEINEGENDSGVKSCLYEARFIASTRNKALAAIAKAERGWR